MASEASLGCEAVVKSLRNDALSLKDRLNAVHKARLPRKQDLLIHFLLREVRNPHAEKVKAAWEALDETLASVSISKLAPLLRKANLIVSLTQVVDVAPRDELHAVLRAGRHILHYLLKERSLAKSVACSIDMTLAAIRTALAKVRPADSLLMKRSADYLETSVEFAIFNAQYRHSIKKLTEELIKTSLNQISIAMEHQHLAGPLEHLLRQTLWSEACVNDFAAKTDVLEQAMTTLQDATAGFISSAFKSISALQLSPEKHCKLANTLLRDLLPRRGISQQDLLQSYHDSLPRPIPTRVLVSDAKTKTVVQHALEADALLDNAAVLSLLISIDLDIVLPLMDKVWVSLEQRGSMISLERPLFRMFAQIRAIDEFLLPYARLSPSPILNKELLNDVADHTRQMSEPVQADILDRLLADAQSPPKSRRLEVAAAIIAGLPRNSTLLIKHRDTIWQQMGHAEALLKFVTLCKLTGPMPVSCERLSGLYDIQLVLRSIELGDLPSEKGLRLLFKAMLSKDIDQSGHNELWVAVADRWLPSVAPLMDAAELSLLAQRLLDVGLQAEMNVLESTELAAPLQKLLLSRAVDDKDLSTLLTIPVEYYSKANRQKLVQLLASRKSHRREALALLAKFARHDIFARLSSDTFLEFAVAADQVVLEAYVTHMQPVDLVDVLHKGETALHSKLATLDTAESGNWQAARESVMRHLRINIAILDRCGAVTDQALTGSLREARGFFIRRALSASVPLLEALWEIKVLDKHKLYRDTLLQVATSLSPEITRHSFQDLLLTHVKERDPKSTATIKDFTLPAPRQQFDLDQFALMLLASLADTPERAMRVLLSQGAFPGTTTSEIVAASLPEAFHLQLLTEARGSLSVEDHLVLLQAFVERRAEPSPDYLQICFQQTCKKLCTTTVVQRPLRILHTLVDRHPRVVHLAELDSLFGVLPRFLMTTADEDAADVYLQITGLLRMVFERRAHLLKDRHHVVLQTFALLLSSHLELALTETSTTTITFDRTEAFTRLFNTFLSSSRQVSSSPEQFNRALAKHLPWLLIEYIHLFARPALAAGMPVDCKRILEEGFAYEVMGLCGVHEREMVGAALDSGRRVLFKRLFEDWSKFGRWNET